MSLPGLRRGATLSRTSACGGGRVMKRLIFIFLLPLATGAFGAAQLYRWVDEKGNVEYRDTPPPKSAKKVEERKVVTSTIETSAPSYAMQQAIKSFPVTLWAYDCGEPCANARAHLAKRGVQIGRASCRERGQRS